MGSGPLAGIATGADGNLWFANSSGKIGQITPAGGVNQFSVPANTPSGITSGPDGNLWFGELTTFGIGRITPSGTITSLTWVGLRHSSCPVGRMATSGFLGVMEVPPKALSA